MRGRFLIQVLAGVALAVLALAAEPALAGGSTTQLTVTGGTLVRGAAPLPEFHLDFLLDQPARQTVPWSPLSTGASDNLEIALTSPDNRVLSFIFSPRAQFGLSSDHFGGNRGYAGLTWNLFNGDHLFGNFGVAGAYDPASTNPNDPLHHLLGPPLLLHGALELGYHIGGQHSLSFSIDQGRSPELKLNPETTTDNFRVRYGLKF
jgi:hypothetical protein